MNRSRNFRVILFLIVVALFNLTFFMLGGSVHPVSVWTAYGFMHAAWLLLFVTPMFTRAAGRPLFGLPAMTFASVCFILEAIVGTVIIITRPVTYTVSLLIQIIIVGVFFAVLVGSLSADEHTAQNVASRDTRQESLREMANEVKALTGVLEDEKANREIKMAYDLLHASPIEVSGRGAIYEPEIISLVYELRKNVEEGDAGAALATAKKLQLNITLRNG